MKNLSLWNHFKELKEKYYWVDLTFSLSPSTPHWVGWEPLSIESKANLSNSIFKADSYKTVGQYGTHVDSPNHMVKGGRCLDEIELEEMIYPLCVIDKSKEATENPDFILSKNDILDWEEINGKIPEGAFVAFRTDWSKRLPLEMDNLDKEGKRHFPGWGLDALKFLVEERNIGSIGHETSDTESPTTSSDTDYEVEYYILEQNRIQIELLKDLDKCPAVGSIIFCTFPKVVDASGFPARCFALCPK